jgi:hypothetical protein
MQAPPGSSLPPLIVVAPPLQQQAVSPSTVVLPAAWPPAGDLVSAFDDNGGAVVVGHEHDQDGVPSHGATAAAPVAAAPSQKPVVTEELKAKIVKQVEFYFSDTNLPTDNYLMKYVKKDPQGFGVCLSVYTHPIHNIGIRKFCWTLSSCTTTAESCVGFWQFQFLCWHHSERSKT